MTTSPKKFGLSDDMPIPEKKLVYFRRRLQNRFHALILEAFMRQEKETGLNQKKLARRIRRKPEVINRWLSSAGNWELDTISDLLLGMDVDLDDPSFTALDELVRDAEQKSKRVQINGRTGPEHARSRRKAGGIRASAGL